MASELVPYLSPLGVLLGVAVMVYTDRLIPHRAHMREVNRLEKLLAESKLEGTADRLRADDATKQLIHILGAVNAASAANVTPAETP